MTGTLRAGLVGVRKGKDGISGVHIENLLSMEKKGAIDFTAAAETMLKDNTAVDMLIQKGKKVFGSHEEMIRGADIDVVTIATPHFTHVPMAIDFLMDGTHVFLEKPPAVTIDSANLLMDYAKECKRVVGVNYMHTASIAVHDIKDLLDKNVIGDIEYVIAKGRWMRTNEYFKKRSWAGKKWLKDQPCLDGCMFNQFPHMINLALYLLTKEGTPVIDKVKAELYRAHRMDVLEMEDTASLYARVNGTDVHVYCTTCYDGELPLELEIVGKRGKIIWYADNTKANVKIFNEKGEGISDSGYSQDTWQSNCFKMYLNFLLAVNEGKPLYWNLEQASATTRFVNAAYESSQGIRQIDPAYVNEELTAAGGASAGVAGTELETKVLIQGIEEAIDAAAKQRCMFSEVDKEIPAFKEYKGRSSNEVDPKLMIEFDMSVVK